MLGSLIGMAVHGFRLRETKGPPPEVTPITQLDRSQRPAMGTGQVNNHTAAEELERRLEQERLQAAREAEEARLLKEKAEKEAAAKEVGSCCDCNAFVLMDLVTVQRLLL